MYPTSKLDTYKSALFLCKLTRKEKEKDKLGTFGHLEASTGQSLCQPESLNDRGLFIFPLLLHEQKKQASLMFEPLYI